MVTGSANLPSDRLAHACSSEPAGRTERSSTFVARFEACPSVQLVAHSRLEAAFHFLSGTVRPPAFGYFPFARLCLPLPPHTFKTCTLAKAYSSFGSQVNHHFLGEAPIASQQSYSLHVTAIAYV